MQSFLHPESQKIAQLFSHAKSDRALHELMDENKKHMEEQGFTETRRVKIGRNDDCPCGSGKKFKKCHLNEVDRNDDCPCGSGEKFRACHLTTSVK